VLRHLLNRSHFSKGLCMKKILLTFLTAALLSGPALAQGDYNIGQHNHHYHSHHKGHHKGHHAHHAHPDHQ
jgi:hypothetical protein